MKLLVFSTMIFWCVHQGHFQVTKTQKGYYICTKKDNILSMRVRVDKDTDPVSQARAVDLDGSDIDVVKCPIAGTGTDTDPYGLSTSIDCTHLPRMNDDGCGVRYDTVTGVTTYTWRIRTRQVQDLNCEYDIVFIMTCDCNTAGNMEVSTVPISVDPIADQNAQLIPCTIDLKLYDGNGNNEIAKNGGTGYYRVVLLRDYSIRAALTCPIGRVDKIIPYGVYLKNVRISNNAQFSGSDVYTMVDADGCNVDLNNPFELTVPCSVGPTRPGETWVYRCFRFTAASFQNAPQDMLYLGAEVEFCYDFADTSCVRKCPPLAGRRKRSTNIEEGYDKNSTVRVAKMIIGTENDELLYIQREKEARSATCEMEETYIKVFVILGALLFIVTITCTVLGILLCRRRPRKEIGDSMTSSANSTSSKLK